ncbi:MAG: AAA family ATPase, partial [Patescibacteria group bacterium]
MHISSVYVRNWKNFPEVRIRLERRAFFIGPNASGKSNFLDIFRFLRDITRDGGGLQQAILTRGGISSIRSLSARKNSDIGIKINLLDEPNERWAYELVISKKRNSPKAHIVKEIVKRNEEILVQRPDAHDNKDAERLTETSLEQISENKDFRKVSDFFNNVKYRNLIPQLIKDPEEFRTHGATDFDPYGRDFLDYVEKTHGRYRNARLKNILSAIKIAAPQVSGIRISRDSHGKPHLVGYIQHWRSTEAQQNETQFSDGTLRLFGLLWLLFETPAGLLLLEEPELSLHAEIVRHIPQMIEQLEEKRKTKQKNQL